MPDFNFHVKQQPTCGSTGLGGGVHNVGTIWKPRADPNAQYLKVAYSGLSEHGYRNVASLVNVSNDVTPVFIPRGTNEPIFNQSVVKWTSEGYDSSLELGTRNSVSGWFASEDPVGGSTTRDLQAFGNSTYTFETWVYIPTFPNGSGKAMAIFFHTNDTDSGFKCLITGNNFGNPQRGLYWTAFGSGTAYTSANVLSTNTWHHIAYVRIGTSSANTNLRLYVDGIDRTAFRNGQCNQNWDYTGPLFCAADQALTEWDTVKIQDYRVYQGVAKYTSNFSGSLPNSMFVKN
jgi:hypothetical protein